MSGTADDAPPTDWLAELPHELHLRILEGVDDFSDCAAFSLASPRLGLLGLLALLDPTFQKGSESPTPTSSFGNPGASHPTSAAVWLQRVADVSPWLGTDLCSALRTHLPAPLRHSARSLDLCGSRRQSYRT